MKAPKTSPGANWLDRFEKLSAKAKRTLTPNGAAQFEHDKLAVANMRRLLAERQARIEAAR